MEHIGSGWQFDAYASGNRVWKIPVSRFRMATRVLRSYPTLVAKPFSLMVKIQELTEDRDLVLQEINRLEIDGRLLANFRREGGRYIQDLVKPLGDVLEEGRLDPYWLMDRYVDSVRRSWNSGFAETSFNFTVNHGLDRRGQVVIVDVGELTFDKRDVARLIEKKFWEKAFSARTLPKRVRAYLYRAMERTINLGQLEREWSEARPLDRARPAPDRQAARRTDDSRRNEEQRSGLRGQNKTTVSL
ncbi:MAG: hypothetical protein ACI9W4_002369 [Rhodothermales bacterium]|jgi:hypothetical protein